MASYASSGLLSSIKTFYAGEASVSWSSSIGCLRLLEVVSKSVSNYSLMGIFKNSSKHSWALNFCEKPSVYDIFSQSILYSCSDKAWMSIFRSLIVNYVRFLSSDPSIIDSSSIATFVFLKSSKFCIVIASKSYKDMLLGIRFSLKQSLHTM